MSDFRRARPDDADAITATITSAFHTDPVWSWAFPDEAARPAQFTKWWRLFVDAALRDGWVWVTDGCEAITMWSEPGVEELNDDDIAKLLPLLTELLGDRAAVVGEMLLRFDANHPAEPPHYYLSFVATHRAHQGQRLGQRLLSHNLRLIDKEHQPAYLESSNPMNEPRYARLGFEETGRFDVADEPGVPYLVQMWRDAR